jgi:membrane fusion protein
MTRPSSSALFRPQVLYHQTVADAGETVRIVPVTHALFAGFLVAVLAIAVAYVSLAGYARKETARGMVAPSHGVVRVIAPRAGTITEVLVAEGDTVSEDQLLFRVVAEETNAAGTGSDTAILEAMKQQKAILEHQIEIERDHAAADRARLDAQIRNLQEEAGRLETQRTVQAQRAKETRAFYDRIAPLLDKGIVTAIEVQSRLQNMLSEEQAVAALDERLAMKRGDLRQAQLSLERLPIEEADKLANLQRNLSDVAQHAAETEARRRYIVRAPIAGRVSSMVATVGRTIDPRISQLSIVPLDSRFEAELFVPAIAIGFVAPGQRVRLLYDAFPYQRFGTYGGTITSVATTMLAPAEMPEPVAALKEPGYRIKVALDRQTVQAFGHEVALQPDMTLRADIILEQRTMLEWLLEPLLSARQRLS